MGNWAFENFQVIPGSKSQGNFGHYWLEGANFRSVHLGKGLFNLEGQEGIFMGLSNTGRPPLKETETFSQTVSAEFSQKGEKFASLFPPRKGGFQKVWERRHFGRRSAQKREV